METTRILWSGLTGKTGREALKQAANVPGVEIVAGLTRQTFETNDSPLRDVVFTNVGWLNYETNLVKLAVQARQAEVDVVVDFSHPDALERVLDLAVLLNKPLIIGTAGLSDVQLTWIKSYYCYAIPIYRGGNFLFKVKDFLDQAVALATSTDDNLTLYENFYEGKKLPSEVSKVLQQRIQEATGKTIGVFSSATLDRASLACDWRIGDLHCHTVGFGELTRNILEIAKVMTKKSIREDGPYDLDAIWNDLVH